ncbi:MULTISPECIES: metal ABC transporter solute-binding protein, Zn/Mn family [unclassified Nesterenkonia]|uniref:metal ABC transporter solute-binding protein, Zn/Mn family n=1 Tax=unclassified Nesterenkonia TaxID=2629769 RepID=UPI0008726727|nr:MULTISPECIES: zinc ABC transporter substrate-binding protein [unclassified Nesterenkonia]MDS2171422.1 zinc ABC transporter substrate-binding protein [Nesterenkonia sp. CL21]OSM44404.1 metal ABC transporter substrate-binding protein [Nesterenkonia sp. PF2B19]
MPHTTTTTSAALLALSTLLVTSCASADGSGDPSERQGGVEERPVVLTTFTVLQDIASEVAGDRADVRSITPHGAEIHEYDPTPGDVRDAAEADLILANGLGLEAWLEQFLDQSDAPTVTVTGDIEPLPVTRLPGHPDDAAEMPVNPHAWMSPRQGMSYVDGVEDALSELSPEDADVFAENAAALRDELAALDVEARERAEELEEVHLVTCEGAFSYLADDLDLGEHYLWPVNADDEGSPQQVEAQIRYVRDHEVPTVFCESTVNDAAQQQVVQETGAELGEPLYVDSLTEADGPVPTYVDLLRHDLELILAGAEDDGR